MINGIFGKKQTRRDFIKTTSVALAGIAGSSFLSSAWGLKDKGPVIRGTVFNDENQDGISGVLVSDGISVVHTDTDGKYELETTASTLNQYSKKLVFITTPSGYELDSKNFYKVLPLPLNEDIEVNFGLRKSQSEQGKFNFIFMADMHIGATTDTECKFFLDTVEDIKRIKQDMGINFAVGGGDICHDKMDLYSDIIKQLEPIGIPVFNAMGNHDLDENPGYKGPRKGRFNDYYGPTYFSFDHGAVHFIVLDTAEWVPGIGPHNVIGCIDNDRKEWLKNDLGYVEKDKPVVIMCHIPLETTLWERRSDGPQWKPCWEVVNNTAVFDILKGYNVKFIFQGHMHENEHIFKHNIDINSVGAVSGTWWQRTSNPYCPDGSPKGYLIVSVDDEEIVPLYKGTDEDKTYQLEIIRPEDGLTNNKDISIMANVFDGSQKSRLFYKIDDGHWKPMSKTKTALRDTRISESQTFWKTYHIWLANAEKPAGRYGITVKAIDRYGREWSQIAIQ